MTVLGRVNNTVPGAEEEQDPLNGGLVLIGTAGNGAALSSPVTINVQDDVPELVVNPPTAGITPSFSLTYHGGEAGQNNSVGFYIKDADGTPVAGAVLFDGVRDKVPADGTVGTLTVGGKDYTVTLSEDGKGYTVRLPHGEVTPDQVGFFLLPNGGASPDSFDLTAVKFEKSGDAWTVTREGDDVVLNSDASGTASRVFFSDSALNQGGHSYVQANASGIWAGDNGDLNWEDLKIGAYSSDKDYEDVNLTLKWEGVPLIVSDKDADELGESKDTDADLGETQLSSRFEVHYGADGAAANDPQTINYSLVINKDKAELWDTATQEQVRLTPEGDGVVRGVIGTGADEKTVFTLSVDDDGVLTLTQERAVLHGSSNPHDITNLGKDVLSLQATVTATDGDGDTVTDSASYDIGHQLNFLDCGPEAGDDFAAVTAVADGKAVSAIFNVFNGVAGVGTDRHEGMDDGAQAQVVWVRTGGDRSYAATDFLEGTETSVMAKGAMGKLTIEKDGQATYTLDDIKAKALGQGETYKDQFSYQMKDADGDTDVANITVTVTGVNDAPEFVTGVDKTTLLWIDENGDGKQDVGETSLYSAPETGDKKDSLTLTADESFVEFRVADPDIGDKPKVSFNWDVKPEGVTSGGKPVEWFFNEAEVYGKVADEGGVETTVVTVSITQTDSTDYKAEFLLGAPIDGDGAVNLEFELVADDGNGGKDTMALTVEAEGVPYVADVGALHNGVPGDDETSGAMALMAAAVTENDVPMTGDDDDASFSSVDVDVIDINLADHAEADAESSTDVSGSDSLLIQDILSDTEGLDLAEALSGSDTVVTADGEGGDGAGAVQQVEEPSPTPDQSQPADIALEADILTMTTMNSDPSIT